MTLTKAHIIERLFAKNLFTKGESAQLVETLFELIKRSLEEGEDVLISGFGKFCIRDKQQRTGRNPQTGNPLIVTSRRVVTFKCSGLLKGKMNHPESTPATSGQSQEMMKRGPSCPRKPKSNGSMLQQNHQSPRCRTISKPRSRRKPMSS